MVSADTEEAPSRVEGLKETCKSDVGMSIYY
jgi:hypothetical protein